MSVELSKLPKARLGFIKPMLARLTERVPTEGGWVYELKLDGYRTQVMKKRGRVTLF